MRIDAKARMALALTFALGIAVGVFATAEFFRPRGPEPERASASGELPRFVREMEKFLRPHDDAQRAALRPLLLSTDSLNRETVQRAQETMRDALKQLRERAAPVLDAAQRQRLDRFIAEKALDRGPGPAFAAPRGGPGMRP